VDKYFIKLPFQELETKYNNWFFGRKQHNRLRRPTATFRAAVDKLFHIKFIHDIGY